MPSNAARSNTIVAYNRPDEGFLEGLRRLSFAEVSGRPRYFLTFVSRLSSFSHRHPTPRHCFRFLPPPSPPLLLLLFLLLLFLLLLLLLPLLLLLLLLLFLSSSSSTSAAAVLWLFFYCSFISCLPSLCCTMVQLFFKLIRAAFRPLFAQ